MFGLLMVKTKTMRISGAQKLCDGEGTCFGAQFSLRQETYGFKRLRKLAAVCMRPYGKCLFHTFILTTGSEWNPILTP